MAPNSSSKTIWQELKKPLFVLAPMYDVTDTAFRQVILQCGRPDIFFTEFVSVDGLVNPKSQEKLIKHYFQFEEIERPIVAQVFGSKPEYFYQTAQLVKQLGFDGMDINMGCPDKKVMQNGMGAALCLTPELAREIIAAAKEGSDLPISVKTRLGYDKNILEEWLGALLKAKPAAITIHARTARQKSDAPADWPAVGRAVQQARGSGIPILGNGDVKSLPEARQKVAEYGVDGVMIGRGIFENLWLFDETKDPASITAQERLTLALTHARLFEKYFAGIKNFSMMYKHFHAYASGFPGAKEVRIKLMTAKSAAEVEDVLSQVTKTENYGTMKT